MSQKNYEVIAYRQRFGEGLIVTRSSGENAWYTAVHETENYEIFTVQRLSDGETFSIGDKLEGNWPISNSIMGIELQTNAPPWLSIDNINMYGQSLLSAEKVREEMKTEEKTILETAQELIYGDRQAAYGSVTDNFTRIAQMWSAILGVEVSASDVGLCMIAVKMARQVNKPGIDNLTDIAGYAGCLEKLDRGE